MMKKVNMFIEKYHMITDGDRIIAGISGGADSVCLLFVLLELQKKMDIHIIAVHVNHGIRGESAARDEQFVRDLCGEHQIECVVYHENVELIAKNRKQSVEEAGRSCPAGIL
ncbi:MAG: ATP-binding protein [Muricomes sp.]